jgi:hypothetical protein
MRRLAVRQISEDACRLISAYGPQAYFKARRRARGETLDGELGPRHWKKVKLEIARRQKMDIGNSGGDR